MKVTVTLDYDDYQTAITPSDNGCWCNLLIIENRKYFVIGCRWFPNLAQGATLVLMQQIVASPDKRLLIEDHELIYKLMSFERDHVCPQCKGVKFLLPKEKDAG